MKNISNIVNAYADVCPGCANYWECVLDLTDDILDNIDEADIAEMKLPAEALDGLDTTFRLVVEARVNLLLFYVYCVLVVESGRSLISYLTKQDSYREKALHIAERFAKSSDYGLILALFEDYGCTLEISTTKYTISTNDSPATILQALTDNDFDNISYDGKTMTAKARYSFEKELVFKF
jgi:hypothetical protein